MNYYHYFSDQFYKSIYCCRKPESVRGKFNSDHGFSVDTDSTLSNVEKRSVYLHYSLFINTIISNNTSTMIIVCIFIGTHASAKQLMLGWIQALLPSWNITNFKSDWKDGRALLALIHEIKPDKAPSVSTLDPRKGRSNCTLAIRTAKMYLKVPPIITADAIVHEEIDEMSMMTYLSYFLKPASRSLLKWVKEKLPNRKINNLTSDWIDGISFAALTNAVHPSMFSDWRKLSSDTPTQNISQVIETTERHLGIKSDVDAASMAAKNVEELYVATYILRIRSSKLVSLPEEIVVSGPGLKNASVGKQTQFLIDTTKGGPGKLLVNANYEESGLLDFSLQEKNRGEIKLIYTPPKAGNVSFDILWSDNPIPNSPFIVTVCDGNLIKLADEAPQTVVHVLTTVKIKLDASSALSGQLTANLFYPGEPAINLKVTENEGMYTIEMTPHKAGYPTLQAYWNKQSLPHCKVDYTVLDNRQYTVTEVTEKKVFRTFEEVKFKVESTGLPLKALRLVAISDDIQIPFDFSTIEKNSGQAVFTPTLPGDYGLEVACVDRLVDGTPILIRVIDPLKAVLQTKLPKYLALNSPFEFVINTKEAGPGPIEFRCLDDGVVPDCFSVEVDSTELSLATLVVTPSKLGEFLVTLTHSGVDVTGCPFRATICDPMSCIVTGDLMKKSMAVGSSVHYTISSPDGQGLKPVVRARGPTAKYQTTLNEKGKGFSGEFTPWEIGEHEVTVTLGGFPVKGSPFHFEAINVDTSVCSASGAGLQEALTNIPGQFVVLAKQPGLIAQRNLEISVYGVINNVQGVVRARDNNNGTYNIAYVVEEPGSYLISIKAWGKPIPGSPFRMNALLGPDASKCAMFGPALNSDVVIKIGDPIDFSVDTSKAGKGNLKVAAIAARGIQARMFLAKGDKPGVYDIKLDPLRSGKHRVGIKWSGNHIPGSPFTMRILPGADATKCRAYGPGLEDGMVGDSSHFTIETRDAGSGILRVKLNGVRNAFNITLKPVSSTDPRTLRADYSPKKPGEYLITIKWSEKDIPGSPFKVKIGGEAVVVEENNSRLATICAPPELSTIQEEMDSSEESESRTSLSTKSQPQITTSKEKKKNKGKTKHLLKSASTNDLPVFKGRSPNFHNAFVTKNSKKAAKTIGSAQAQQMMTFSKLRLGSHTIGPQTSTNSKGNYFRQAQLHINSMRNKKL